MEFDYTMSAIDIILPITGVGLSVVAFLYSMQRASKDDLNTVRKEALLMEHRLTVLEQNQFSNEDRKNLAIVTQNQFTIEERKCLIDTSIKVNMFYQAAKQEAPDMLKHSDTPRYDELLSKAKLDLSVLTADETNELLKLIQDDIDRMKLNESTRDAGRVFIATLYANMIKLEKKQELVNYDL
jgi:uncharacterized small protein (DUF1192 family)